MGGLERSWCVTFLSGTATTQILSLRPSQDIIFELSAARCPPLCFLAALTQASSYQLAS